jgi:membrane protease YdiL (CAAX protease family)
MAKANPMVRSRGITRYLAQSRDGTNSLILVAPLFVFYQIGILFTDGWRNGADLITGFLLQLTGGNLLAYSVVNLVALAVVVGVYFKRREVGTLTGSTAALVVLESSVYALFAGGLVGRMLLSAGIQPAMTVSAGAGENHGLLDTIVLSVGAGTWEELVFRGMLMTGIAWGMRRRGAGTAQAWIIAILSSSLIFSAFHYWPFGMDPWELWSFSFRFLLGVGFALLYLWRGFAVAVYTHAIYDIFVLVPAAIFG